MILNLTRRSTLALAIGVATGAAWAQQPAVEQAAVEQSAEDDTKNLDSVVVTGTRLQKGDPTSQVIVISEAEIKSRGVTSVEELIRTLPQNLNTIGAITNERLKGPLSNRADPVSQIGSLGVSAANLGGMGAGNTLVLVNGRRIAGAAGIEDGFVNLNGIPLSAVERVEITTSGASAIYGADAIGGVINFVLKSNYVGSTLSLKHEYSSNGADVSQASAFTGYAWGTGSVSASLTHSKRRPVNNFKTGYTTQDYSGYYDGDTAFDTRSWSRGLQPGVIDRTTYLYDDDWNVTIVSQALTLPEGFTGVPEIYDFIMIGRDRLPDYVPRLAGPDSESTGVSVNFEQKVTSRLSLFVDGLFNRSENSQELLYDQGLSLQLAPGQAYNPFPAYYFDDYSISPSVYYAPFSEVAAGELPVGKVSNTASNWSISAGARFEFTPETRLEFVYNTSKAYTNGQSPRLASEVSIVEDPDSPGGYRCANFFLDNDQVEGADRDYLQAIFDRQCLALTSSDPNLAFNPWKSSANGGGSSVADFFYTPIQESRESRVENIEARLNGSLIELPGGKAYYVVGGEMYSDGVDSNEVRRRTGTSGSRDRYALFGELSVPIFGEEFAFPFLNSLMFSVAARHDSYTTEGAIGTVDNVSIEDGGQLIYAENDFARTTPAYGFLWKPFETLSVRGRWTEGFQPPPHTQLFSSTGTRLTSTQIVNDPLYTCTNDCAPGQVGNIYTVPSRTAPNPDLRPQTSTQQSYGFTWRPKGTVEGLTLDVAYNRTKIDNEFSRLNELNRFLKQDQIFALEQFYPRDPTTGRILEARNMIFNIRGSEYASILYDLSYMWITSRGTFEPRIVYLDNLTAERQAFSDVPAFSTLGLIQGPDDYKVTGSLGWYYHDINATLWAYYTPGYINDYDVDIYAGVISGASRLKQVDSMLTIDLTAGWRVNNDFRVNFAARNVFDKRPPFVVVGGRPYDTSRWNVAGRTVAVELEYSF